MDFPYMGTYKHGAHYQTEDALDYVWDQIRRHSSREYLDGAYRMAGTGLTKAEVIDYCLPRFRQACEFRASSRGLSLVTKPLPLYYALLNMTRAFVVLRDEAEPSSSHGLRDSKEKVDDLLSYSVLVTKGGTFGALWHLLGNAGEFPERLTLKDCLSQIPEILWQFNSPWRGMSLCVPVTAGVRYPGYGELTFAGEYLPDNSFSENWKSWFPDLATCAGECNLSNPGKPQFLTAEQLVFRQDHNADQDRVIAFARTYLTDDIMSMNNKRFFLTLRRQGVPPLRREAAYLGAMFILGSIVRYDPESLLKAAEPDAEVAWFLESFLKAAERFYPQLMLSLARGERLYLTYP